MSAGEWEIRSGERREAAFHEPIRPLRVPDLRGYVDPWGVKPGQELSVHLTAPAAHTVAVYRLGREIILNPRTGPSEDRASAEQLGHLHCSSATPAAVHPGSYGLIERAGLDRPKTVCVWIRLWRAPTVNEDWAYSAIVSDFDYPASCAWELAIDPLGRACLYAGDGAAHQPEAWCVAEPSIGDHLGLWVHLTAVLGDEQLRIFIDGELRGEHASVGGASTMPGTLRVGANAQNGVADGFLDADLSSLFLVSRELDQNEIASVAADRSISRPEDLGIGPLLASWPMREPSGPLLRDIAGGGHDLRVVNGATFGIPGPGASATSGHPGYDPATDPSRGGAVRFASDDLLDCQWPCAAKISVPRAAASGLYSVRITLAGASAEDATEIPFVVVRPTPNRRNSVVLLCPTFTWTAYGRQPHDDITFPGLNSSFYATHLSGMPFYQLGLRVPLTNARPFRGTSHRPEVTLHDHLVRPERLAEAWLENEGYAYECITDMELHREPEILDRFAALMIVGHSEYWSREMRAEVDRYLTGGGAVVCLSGNTLYWRTSVIDEPPALEVRKVEPPGARISTSYESALLPRTMGERWHTDGNAGGTWTLLEEPTHDVLGLEMLGWIDCGEAAAFAPYRVERPDHFLFHEPEIVPLEPDRLIGTRSLNGPAASGFEMDGIPEQVGLTPDDIDRRVVLAHADGQHYLQRYNRTAGSGADLIYWERTRGGRVFNAGSIGYSGALAADDGIQALTRNVLHHFGVARRR